MADEISQTYLRMCSAVGGKVSSRHISQVAVRRGSPFGWFRRPYAADLLTLLAMRGVFLLPAYEGFRSNWQLAKRSTKQRERCQMFWSSSLDILSNERDLASS